MGQGVGCGGGDHLQHPEAPLAKLVAGKPTKFRYLVVAFVLDRKSVV